MDIVVTVNALTKSINRHDVLIDINLQVEPADFCGIIGRNGSGKSMLLKTISGLIPATTGSVTVFGKQVGNNGSPAHSTGILIESPGLLDRYSAKYQLSVLAEIAGAKDPKSDAIKALAYVGLDPEDKRNVKKYSLGMRQKVGIAIALMGEPKLLLLDEPTSNLDDNSIDDLKKLLVRLNQDGVTILLASHQKSDVEQLCNRIIELKNGRIICDQYIEKGLKIKQCGK